MGTSDPIAFLSYVRSDDEHDHGRITSLRERLEGEVQMHTGRPFKIFQDKRDMKWGQHWKERIEGTLLSVTFLIPVVTPSYFNSKACREEFEKFQLREKQLGENRLILPIYYLYSDQVSDSSTYVDSIAGVIASRNWADWRGLRFKSLLSADVESAVADMARTIKESMRELERTIAASKAPPPPLPVAVPKLPIDLAKFSPDTPVISDPKSATQKLENARHYAYYAYTRDYDEIVAAEDLSSAEELAKLNHELADKVRSFRNANRSRIGNAVEAIRGAKHGTIPSVTLLIDNSGSLRGDKIRDTAAWTSIVAKEIEGCDIPIEVLGYTTRMWKGGQSRERWLHDGKPKSPGRLNDLRHIVYKKFAAPVKDVSKNFALMTREGVLKENIDGEALLWAYGRVIKFHRDPSIIVVMSDGAPIDDSTLSVNPGNFLDSHLRATIEWLTQQGRVHLLGIGIEFDSTRYYPDGKVVTDTKKIGIELLELLPKWIRA